MKETVKSDKIKKNLLALTCALTCNDVTAIDNAIIMCHLLAAYCKVLPVFALQAKVIVLLVNLLTGFVGVFVFTQ